MENGSENGFEKAFRLNRDSFDYLHETFHLVFSRMIFRTQDGASCAPRSQRSARPRRRALSSKFALAAILFMLGHSPNMTVTAMGTHIPPSTLSRYFTNGMCCLHSVLRNLRDAQCKLPSIQEAENMAQRVKQVSGVRGIAFTMDGKTMRRERPGNSEFQRIYYNGHISANANRCLLLFDMDGCVCRYVVNINGARHDAFISMTLDLETALRQYPCHIKCAGDTAFGTSARLVRPLSETELNALNDNALQSQARTACNNLSSVRIASEWTIGGIVRAFPKLSFMPADDPVLRMILWETCVRLHNLRCRRMGVSQVRNCFMVDRD